MSFTLLGEVDLNIKVCVDACNIHTFMLDAILSEPHFLIIYILTQDSRT